MKKINLLGFSFIILLICAFGVLGATVTIITPASSATQSGAAGVINISFASPGLNYTQCLVNATSTSVNVTTSQYIANVSFGNKDMKINASFNKTYITTELEDSNYSFSAQCTLTNDTVDTSASNTGIIINNTAPTSTWNSPANLNTRTTTGTQTFEFVIVDAYTTSCNYTLARGGATSGNDYIVGTATMSGTNCSFTKAFSSTNDNGKWYASGTASDGSDSRNSGQNILNVEIPASGGGGALAQQLATTTSTTTTTTGTNVFAKILDAIINFFTKLFS
jgi:hypothetical protein